ncbi:MAG: LysR family transcriptional regulator [Peptoniphilaceae bacterium]|nr:LysR family transcriptional regulator [Peptoniphilaceae bacterium]MDY3075646.1 LysR family transcriptional regulator [Peptoniphilaceae bacterium]
MLPNHLRYFIEAVDQKSFTKAAEKLYISQSTISKAVASLEEELRTSLFEHGKRNVVLTASGKLLYAFATDVLNYYDSKEKVLHSKIEKTDNKLRLGLPPTAGSIYFFALIHDFQKINPDVHLKINDATSRYIPDLLINGEIDIGVVIEPFEDDRFIKKVAYRTEAVLIVPSDHPLAIKKSVSFPCLKNENFLQVTWDFQYRKVFEQYCRLAGFQPNICFESNQWDMLLELVADHQGVTILPLPLVEKYKPHNLEWLHLIEPEFPWALTVIRPKRNPVTRSMQKFMDLL